MNRLYLKYKLGKYLIYNYILQCYSESETKKQNTFPSGGGTIESAKIKDDSFWENWWKITDKTIFYAPLNQENQLKNLITWANPTNTRWSFTYDENSCEVWSGSMYRNLWQTMYASDKFTIFQWLKPYERRSYSQRLWYPTWLWFEQWVSRNDTWNQPRFAQTEWSSARWANNAWPMPLNERHCWISVWTWTWFIVYKDWVAKDYTNNWQRASWSSTEMRFSVNNQYDYYRWRVAHLWVEKWAWEQKDVDKFYKTFKDLFV